MKPRVMSLVLFTGIVGMFLAPVTLHPARAVLAILCIALGAGGAGALNMWYDRDIDATMSRTAARPIPVGRVAPGSALALGALTAVGSVAILGLVTNWVAAAMLALTISFYVFIYTIWLKRRTPQNIVIGGAAGALPPVVGWAAATGNVEWPALILFAIIFFWTPPHFWALALFFDDDFEKAGLPMLPAVKGHLVSKRYIFAYTLILLPVALLPYPAGIAGPVYLAVAAVLGLTFAALAWRLIHAPPDAADAQARGLFKFSLLYLFALFAVLLAEHVITALL